jgi:hypothetical protein
LVKQELGVAEEDIDTVRERAHAKGFEAGRKAGCAQARSLYRLTFACSICQGPTAIPAGSEAAKVATAAVVAGGWAHDECSRRVQ